MLRLSSDDYPDAAWVCLSALDCVIKHRTPVGKPFFLDGIRFMLLQICYIAGVSHDALPSHRLVLILTVRQLVVVSDSL